MKISTRKEFAKIDEYWKPRIVGKLNGQEIKLVKFKGEFPRHLHEFEDEMFLVINGSFKMNFDDQEIEIGAGEFIIVPRGKEHSPIADEEVEVMLFEPAGISQMGDLVDPALREESGDNMKSI